MFYEKKSYCELTYESCMLMAFSLKCRASAANLLGGKGIIGTYDGLVYIWDLCSGRELFNLQLEKGKRISARKL